MLATYRVGVRPHKHLFDLLVEIDGVASTGLELWLPSWTPGSYLIREYARHLQDIRAEGSGGQPLRVERVSEDAWRVETAGHSVIRISYSVYALDLSVRTSHLDESHAYFNGASLFLTCDALQGQPATVALDLPPGWKVETSLARLADNEFRARDYHELCDSPVHCGPDDRAVDFTAAGVPHRLAIWGTGNEDLPALARSLEAIVAQAAKVFGGALPYERYLFLTLLTDRGRGGLEHRESSTLLYPRFGFRPEKSRQDFLLLAAHELFHAWIVKRLRPLALIPYRYRAESFTKLLWFFEGFTSYYEALVCLRAGLLSPARFLEIWGERMTQLARTPGRRVQSLEEASLVAWIKFYRQDENSPNSSVSYYLKGSLVALSLEGELRGRSLSLDQLLRLLWERYGRAETGMPEDGVRAAAEELAGGPLPRVFGAVAGLDDPDYASLEALGLRARVRVKEGTNDRGGGPARSDRERGSNLGLTFKPDRLVIQSVLSDGPAEQAGLSPDDELMAADGFRLTPESCALRLEQQAPGKEVRLTYFRREELRETVLILGERALDTCWIERVESPTDAQRKAYLDWTGSPL